MDERMLRAARLRAEENRPRTAQITVKDGTAVLKLLDRNGAVADAEHIVTLPGSVPYLSGPVLTLAGEFLDVFGFRLDGGWDDELWNQGVTRTAIDMTPEYVAWLDRRYGPVPELGELPTGMTYRTVGYGRWALLAGSRSWELLYRPKVTTGGDWELWTPDLARPLGRFGTPQEAARTVLGPVLRSRKVSA